MANRLPKDRSRTNDPPDIKETLQMVVRDVRFAAAGKAGPSGEARTMGGR
ncbi:MAG: hypothetical protein OXP09_21075 [Gammaproteobacteria bacterium]|nr:hypothetical protein [Gammaproteobacteria bacterium]